VEIPEAQFERPNVQLQTITQVQFESAGWGDTSEVVAPASAPQLSRFQPVDPASFARRAGLTAGQVASVLLTVEVLPNGRTGTVEVLRGFGDPMVDAAAVAYARHLRWTPGTQNHHAQPMRINLPVALVWNA
jgi:TonB family protein